ncbi:S8/S53 family peptidase [Halorussus caseinilyticus]|uniref:S8/S53 family peptidase n=1 Tax=Halorussus caseinilyticus TaxID=3034025 RepID=A0ABD5WQ81_9EURY|nr:S8/S53 family peptidase [Halorussus sp. DT72]
MSPRENDETEYSSETGRRRFLQGVGVVTATSFVGASSALAAPSRKRTPNPYPKTGSGPSFESDAYFRHISELPSVKRQLESYEKSGKVGHLMTHDLRQKLSDSASGTVDLTVSTCGERSEMYSKGQYERPLHGWRPTETEVKELKKYGDVVFVPDVVSTKVGLSNVAVGDIPKIAALDFVLEIGHDPALEVPDGETNDISTQASNPTADDLKTSSHNSFDSEVYDLTTYTQVGVIGTGYPSTTSWSKNWAESIGIDTNKAKDFVDSDWRTGDSHGTDCADTVAYMLKEGDPESNLIVPLKVWDDSDNKVVTSAFRNAIDYATKNDIPICSTSVETAANEGTCPSTLCEELDSYCSAGYMITCATGNDDKEYEVCHPATSYFTIGVGGYNGSCSGGYSCDPASNYGSILYYDDNFNTTYCSWCYNAAGQRSFQPDVYACYSFDTDAGNNIAGTSFAAPVVAAGGAVHHSVHGSTGYGTHRSKYHGMNNHTVCPSESSNSGDVLHVPDLT